MNRKSYKQLKNEINDLMEKRDMHVRFKNACVYDTEIWYHHLSKIVSLDAALDNLNEYMDYCDDIDWTEIGEVENEE